MTLKCRILNALTTDPRFKSQSLDSLPDCARVALWLAETLYSAGVIYRETPDDVDAEPTPEAQARQHAEAEYVRAVQSATKEG